MQSGCAHLFPSAPRRPFVKIRDVSFSQSRETGKHRRASIPGATLTHAGRRRLKIKQASPRDLLRATFHPRNAMPEPVATSDRTRIVREPQRAVYDRELIYKI